MATHDPATNTYTLLLDEVNFALLPEDGDANVVGNDQDNEITGNAGANSLDGGAGADTLRGGLGDDTYLVDDEGDAVIEEAGQEGGYDTVIARRSYSLGAHVEKLILADPQAIVGKGNDLDNLLIGNQSDNILEGRDGNDTLMGGTTGFDTLRGGRGDDVYYLFGGTVIEHEDSVNGGGNDTIISSMTVHLEDFPDIENLILEGSAHINGFGNALDNVIIGNDGNNTLEGWEGDDSLFGGLGEDHLIGGEGNDTLDGGEEADQLDGGAGDDTYIVDAGDMVNEGADEGHDTVLAGCDFTLGSNIEDLILTGTGDFDGTGNDTDNVITGNDGHNTLDGRGGNDSLFGGLGDDHLIGGEGNDTLDGGDDVDQLEGGLGDDTYVVDGSESIIEWADEGNDTVIVALNMNYTIVGMEIENIVLADGGTATGNDYANRLMGGDNSDDKLDGGKGDDTLNGGQGGDTLIGGEGNDTYYVDSVSDIVDEQANQGDDLIRSYISFNLGLKGAHVERLELLGTASINGTGRDLADTIVGNDGSNVLEGLGGNDTLKGGGGNDRLIGGAGADDLWGGKGDDTYIIDSADTLHEGEDEGRDTVLAGFNSYTLGDNLEDLTFTGTGNFSGIGNALNNFIRGKSGNDILVGNAGNDSLHGGAGADRMDGGTGNDTYWVDDAGDVIVDSGPGFDRVIASTNYTLGANLEYLAFEGTGNFVGTGNELDNYLYGNTGANTLDGGAGRDQIDGGEGNDHLFGGEGDDTITDYKGDDVIDGGAGKDDLRGGVGNDTYYVDGLDLVMELTGEGIDTVTASESFALSAATEVEYLIAKAGTRAINLAGSSTDNAISGNNGANILSGGAGNDRLAGGNGKDVLRGDSGNDTFVFDSRILKANTDKVVAYSAVEDLIFIENSLLKANKVLFKAIGKGSEAKPAALAKKFFTIGSKAKDKDDFFVLDKKKYTLSYDADGSGSKAAIAIATFDKNAMKKFTHKELFFI